MRLAQATKASAGRDRAERMRRDRAAAQMLRTLFPAVEQLSLEFEFESSTANTPAYQAHQMHPPARAFFKFPCPFADCDGGFDLAGPVDTALGSSGRTSHGSLRCSGHRAGASASRQPCELQLNYAIRATLRPGS